MIKVINCWVVIKQQSLTYSRNILPLIELYLAYVILHLVQKNMFIFYVLQTPLGPQLIVVSWYVMNVVVFTEV
jgi:hypothetical protein